MIGFHYKSFNLPSGTFSSRAYDVLPSMLKNWTISKIVATIAKMAKTGDGKWAGLVAVSVLFHLLPVVAQPGFLNINCGGTTNRTAENNITWVADSPYIDVGKTVEIGNATSEGSYLHSLRLFPKPLKKSCYHLPVIPNLRYLLRTWFAAGNYTGLKKFSNFSFTVSIETLGMLAKHDIKMENEADIAYPFKYEEMLVSSGRVLYICLIRTSEANDPFISGIELRPLLDGMYQRAKPGKMLSMQARLNFGGESSVIRYPQDEFDRLWHGMDLPQDVQSVTTQEPISTNNIQDLPPSVVMQTAFITNISFMNIQLPAQAGKKSLLLLYFADFELVNMTFSLGINGINVSNISMVQNYSALEKEILINETQSSLAVQLWALNNSTRVTISGLELYSVFDTELATYSADVEALGALKMKFGLKDWISDPCYIIRWEGIGCDNSNSVVRISEINLSGKNLTGSLSENFGDFTALINLSLYDNNLTGPLPNLSRLIMLKRLHIQNNSLTGTLPNWLCGLESLQELFIDNNNFGGVIPACLFKLSLNFSHSGNRQLQNPPNPNNNEQPNPNNNKLKLILGITLSGSLVIGLASIVSIIVRAKRFRRKESTTVRKGSKHAEDEDDSVIMVPSTTKSRAFTLEEIMEATQNFNQKIGQGGFGSVFFGKLLEKIDIAVKVLSLSGKQGVHEFLNEIDLLSKVNHKNLVSLLGYCNESRELMLVYEHMPGGSLKDHLYGRSAEFSQVNWKSRLKIAWDAAQGLEYLHVGCIPKIIHRDVKTANILLDRNLHGKLSDFGLSRMTIDGEVSHVTTTVKGTLGYLDPEYFSTQMLTEKSDVYSFGVVLLEIICGREPINTKLPEEELNLVRWVKPYVDMDEIPGKIGEIVDKRLGGNYDIKSINHVAKLAIRCVQVEPVFRPNIMEVVAELKEAIKLEKDNASLISEIDIKYEDLGASPACLSVVSSGPKEMESAGSSSDLHTVSQKGYEDLGASPNGLSADSSGPKEIESAGSSSRLPTITQEG